jgi:hypothetical protein
MRKSAG